jgi:hypothetical protein
MKTSSHNGQAPSAGGRPNEFQTFADVVVDGCFPGARRSGSAGNGYQQGKQERQKGAGIEREGAGDAEGADERGRQHRPQSLAMLNWTELSARARSSSARGTRLGTNRKKNRAIESPDDPFQKGKADNDPGCGPPQERRGGKARAERARRRLQGD